VHTTDVVVGRKLKVAVSFGFELKTALHGFVVPVQVDGDRFAGALQPPNKDGAVAVA
jgi:hypothetical protein